MLDIHSCWVVLGCHGMFGCNHPTYINTSIIDAVTLSPYLEDESDDQKLTKRDLHTLNEQRRRDLIKVIHIGTASANCTKILTSSLICPSARICSANGSSPHLSSHFFREQTQPSYHPTKKLAYSSPALFSPCTSYLVCTRLFFFCLFRALYRRKCICGIDGVSASAN